MSTLCVAVKVLNRSIRVDHKHNYQVPKERVDEDELTKRLREQGCQPELVGNADSSDELLELGSSIGL